MAEPERTDHGRYIVVNGRRWRATDPEIPQALRQELVDELMSARRAVGTAKGDAGATSVARSRVQDAKVALGERGEPWWEAGTVAGRAERLTAAMRVLLRHRDPDSTICPSDAARVVGGTGWRDLMDEARAAATDQAAAGVIEVRQHGLRVEPAAASGPIRLARGPHWPTETIGSAQ